MQKIILDVDTGIDDALALLYALGEERVDLIGVTTTYGNIDADQATQNTLNILDLAGATDIPVYQGALHGLESEDYAPREVATQIHGKDGIGEVEIEPSMRKPEEQHAVDFLIESALKHGQKLKLICAGPLTNLTHAYEKNPEAIAQIGEIIFMGGALTVPGNASRFAEANIIEDAVAAKKIIESDLPIKMVGLDVTMRTILTQDETEIWRNYETERSQVIDDMTHFYFQSYRDRLDLLGCALHDPLAVGVAIYPELAETLALDLTVETEEPARGRTIGNNDQLYNENPSTEVCIQVDDEKFLTYFMDAMENILD